MLSGLLAVLFCLSARAATPTAVISASPITGRAPLGVFFDASGSSADSTSFLWEFGDGAASTAKTVTHIYNVAGTYIVRLTVTNADPASATSQITVTVTGTGEGPVTDNMNFRWAPTTASFTLNHANPAKSRFQMNAAFNTVDLPENLEGLIASFSINSIFTVSGLMGQEGGFQNIADQKPTFFIQVNPKEQLLTVFISNADLSAALGATGATNSNVSAPGVSVPVTFALTVSSQTYTITENFQYTSRSGASGQGIYNLKKKTSSINDGFFVIKTASALQNFDGSGHFFEFETYLSRPLNLLLQQPTSGTFVFKFNQADPIVIPFDRIKRNGDLLTYDQSDRDLGGVSRLLIDTVKRKMTIRTWDIKQDPAIGGTGLPITGRPFTGFNFTVRIEFDQPDGTKFQAVTATRLTRRSTDDAFWQTGRRNRKQ